MGNHIQSSGRNLSLSISERLARCCGCKRTLLVAKLAGEDAVKPWERKWITKRYFFVWPYSYNRDYLNQMEKIGSRASYWRGDPFGIPSHMAIVLISSWLCTWSGRPAKRTESKNQIQSLRFVSTKSHSLLSKNPFHSIGIVIRNKILR